MDNNIDLNISKADDDNYKIVIDMDDTVKFRTTSKLTNVDYNVVNGKIILKFDVGNCKIEPIKE